jgi:cytochrome c oxidase subunit 4
VNPTPSLRLLAGTWAALLALLALTVGLARLPLGPWNAALALAISVAKTLLIALVFMHVAFGGRRVRTFAAVTAMWLALLFLTVTDYLSRGR